MEMMPFAILFVVLPLMVLGPSFFLVWVIRERRRMALYNARYRWYMEETYGGH